MSGIDYPSLYEGTEPYIFISYSHNSNLDVYNILHRLNQLGVRFWYDKGLEKGVDWEKHVKEKIEKAAAVFFFFDNNFFYSDSLKREVYMGTDNSKKYCPIYYTGHKFHYFWQMLPENFVLDEDYETDLRSRFNNKITSIIFNQESPDDFYREIVEFAEPINALGKATVSFAKTHKKFVFLAKDSIFSHAIFDGISTVFSSVEHTVDKIYLTQDDIIPIENQFVNYLNNLADSDYSGIMIRLFGAMNKTMFKSFEELCKNKHVVLIDVDISSEQKEALGEYCPAYVCSDFLLGGEKVASLITQIAFSFGFEQTDTIICCNSKQNEPAYIRSNAIKTKLARLQTGRMDIVSLNSLRPEECFNQIKYHFFNNPHHNIKNRCLILYGGNDNVVLYIAKNLQNIVSDNVPISSYKKIVVIGYDGIIGTTGNSILEETAFDYATVDTLPIKQGETAATLLLELTNGITSDKVKRVPPRIVKRISIPPQIINRLGTISPLLEQASLVIMDLDGTIADTETLHWEAYNVLLKNQYGIQLKSEDIARYIGNSEISIYRMIEKDFNINIDDNSFLKNRIAIYLELVEQKNLRPFKWLDEFKANYSNKKVALLTSQIPDVVNYLMKYWGLDELIPPTRRISAHNNKITKQSVFAHPDFYLDVSNEELGNIVVFEDSNHVAKLANNFGYTVIGISHQYNKQSLKDCTCVIDQSIKKGLFVGLSGIDLVFQINQLPEPDQKVKTDQYKILTGGPALNAAITCAKLGGDATLITGIGQGPLSNIIRTECEKYNIHVIDILPYKNIPNISFVAMHYTSATREIISGQTISKEISIPSNEFYQNFDYCLYDCNLPFFTKELVDNLSFYNIPLVLDCGSWKDNIESALHYADCAISSSTFKSPNKENIFALQKENSIAKVAMTRGGDSILYATDDTTGEIAVKKLENARTLGAGDVFHGAFCYYHFDKGYNFEESLKRAAIQATEFVSK